MRKSGRRAGQNVRDLAFKRRTKAVVAFASALLLVLLPFVLQARFNQLLSQLFPSATAQGSDAFNFSPYVYLFFLLVSLGLTVNGVYWWKRANRADQGAKGEEDVSRTLTGLAAAGWHIEYGVRLGGGLGDADIFCTSPARKSYVIDVKSHRGRVMTDGQQLYRMMGNQKHPFEKDFLKQVMKQALQIKQQKNLKFVTPVVAFSDARVSLPAGKIQNVYVVEKSRLPILLEKLG